jgi:hypothetical protein
MEFQIDKFENFVKISHFQLKFKKREEILSTLHSKLHTFWSLLQHTPLLTVTQNISKYSC